MRSVTLTCHPAAFYYWLCEEIFGKVPGLRYKGWSIIPENEFLICGDVAQRVTQRLSDKWSIGSSQDPYQEMEYLHDFVIESENEDLLVWVALAAPNKDTPPRDD